MSKPLRISYVVEGATDYIVLDALVELFLKTDDYVPTQIQPPVSEYVDNQGPLGGGWRGVLKWCQQFGSSDDNFSANLVIANCDILIIHVDADIVAETDCQSLEISAPCPPAKTVCDNIRKYLIALLCAPIQRKVILCVPSQCTEAWVFAALHPDMVSNYQPIECRLEVEKLLIGKPDKLVRDKDGRARKDRSRYKATVTRMALNLENATIHCPEALRFQKEFNAALE